jgi:hypothetical protein
VPSGTGKAWLAAAALCCCGLTACQQPMQPKTQTAAATHNVTNRLAREKSPYLLQHQHNPVDWYAWGDEAFAKARKENKANLPEHRLLDVPLVPRDGTRIF